MNRTFIIYADHFDDEVGGMIALHRLCDLLNRAGERALVWPMARPVMDWAHPLGSLNRLRVYRRRLRRQPFRTCVGFITPVATQADLKNAVVVYPEVVDGNPLGARHVVRWLLHKPGFHTGRIQYGQGDKYFFFQQAFNDPGLNPDADNLLRALFVRDDIYRPTNTGERHGTCHIVRKGKGRPAIHAADSILVDGMSHAQMAEVFNRVCCCISYDVYTMYSLYAAMCGCLSVVVPEEGIDKAQWYPDERDRYGLAYGLDDAEHAERTRHLVLPRLKEMEREANDSVRHFITRCHEYFD